MSPAGEGAPDGTALQIHGSGVQLGIREPVGFRAFEVETLLLDVAGRRLTDVDLLKEGPLPPQSAHWQSPEVPPKWDDLLARVQYHPRRES
jgi:hypothetical protein